MAKTSPDRHCGAPEGPWTSLTVCSTDYNHRLSAPEADFNRLWVSVAQRTKLDQVLGLQTGGPPDRSAGSPQGQRFESRTLNYRPHC